MDRIILLIKEIEKRGTVSTIVVEIYTYWRLKGMDYIIRSFFDNYT